MSDSYTKLADELIAKKKSLEAERAERAELLAMEYEVAEEAGDDSKCASVEAEIHRDMKETDKRRAELDMELSALYKAHTDEAAGSDSL